MLTATDFNYRKRNVITSVLGCLSYLWFNYKGFPIKICNIYLDESGDTGWTLDKPYRNGGSSEYFTIAGVLFLEGQSSKVNRVVKRIYEFNKWPAKKEVKWTDLDAGSRLAFAEHATAMIKNNPTIKLFAITANKHNVLDHIRADQNKLFNYMVKLAFIDEISTYDQVILLPDERGLKVVTGQKMEEYLKTELVGYENSPSLLQVKPQDSQHNKTLQFSDYLAGLIQGNFQDNDTAPWDYLSANIVHKKLFF